MSAVVFVRRRKLSALLVFACLLASWCVYQSKRPSWEAVSRIRDAVSGRTVVIDAGHGGMDPGAVGRSGTREADVVLSIALRLRSLLNRAGVEVVMTRVDDYDLAGAVGSAPAVRKRHDLQERVRLIKEASPDLTVSIHANSFPEPIWSGAQTFFKEGCTEGRLLAVAIQDSLVRDLGPNLRKAKSADLYLLKRIDPPIALVEVGFLSNYREESLLATAEYQQRVAEAVFSGIVSYLVGLDSRSRAYGSSLDSEHSVSGGMSVRDGLFASPDLPPIESAQPGNPLSRTVDDSFVYTSALYFAAPTNLQDGLATEQRSVVLRSDKASTEELARTLLEELIAGPGEKSVLTPVLPKGTKIREVTVRDGLATVDLDGALLETYWGGSRSEELTVYSIVNTLCSLDGIDRVQLAVDGRSDVSIAGHMVLDAQFTYNPWVIAEP